MLTLTLSRESLSLADLVIDGNPYSGSFHLPDDGIEWPQFGTRRVYAPQSSILDGQVLLAAALEVGSLPATVYTHGDTTAELMTARAELEAALGQFSYTVTLAVDGVTYGSWYGQPEQPSWGGVDTGMVRAKLMKATVVIPINPGGA